jgi:hypothetical protein
MRSFKDKSKSVFTTKRLFFSSAVTENFTLSHINNSKLNLEPWWVSGFTDAEGCFTLSIVRNKELKVGWVVKFRFQISLHQKDKALLEQIQNYFCAGNVHKRGSQSLQFRVDSVKDLKVIINHFDKYPLITQKLADYKLLKQAFMLILNKEHLTMEGLRKIVAIKASMNNGLSDELKAAFTNLPPVERPEAEATAGILIRDPQWLAGFTSGEGCLMVTVRKSSTHRTGSQVELVFQINQHSRDEQLMISLAEYLKCGVISKHSKNAIVFKVTKFSDLNQNIIPFFSRYPIIGVKSKDFSDFCKVADIMKEKGHLSTEGLNQICRIKAGMITGRKFET